MSVKNHDRVAFATLGLVWGQCTEETVVKTYRKLALQYHPDRAGPDGLEKMKAINNAKDKIMSKKLCSQRPPTEYPSEPQRPFDTEPFADEPKAPPREYEDWDRERKTQEDRERNVPHETMFYHKMPQKMSTLRSTLLTKLWDSANQDRQEIWIGHWLRVQHLCDSIEDSLEEFDENVVRNHVFFSEVNTLAYTIGEMLEAIKHFKVAAAANFKEARFVYKHWKIVQVMGLSGWCVYEDPSQGANGHAAMEWWMTGFMPDFRRKWDDEADKWSFEDLWAPKLDARR